LGFFFLFKFWGGWGFSFPIFLWFPVCSMFPLSS
jgi:hypothetical protein